MGQVMMVASGKGGVGKSTLSAELGLSFARRGLRCLVMDADVGLRSLDLMLGMQDQVLYELIDCLERRCSLEDALICHKKYHGLHLMVAGQNAKPKDFIKKDLSRVFKTLKNRFDMVIVDAPAGIGRGIRTYMDIVDRFILVATPDEVCLRDTEKIAGILMQKVGDHPYLILNRFSRQLERRKIISKPEDTAMALDLILLGIVPESKIIQHAMLRGKSLPEVIDRELTGKIEKICDRLLGIWHKQDSDGSTMLNRLFGRKSVGL